MPEHGEGPKPEQKPLFPVYETGKLEVPKSIRRLRKMAKDASLDPDTYEAEALKRKTPKAQKRGIMAAGRARLDNYSKDHPELDKKF